ncbi:MAG: methyltransferase, FxLD system [Pseudonocardiaceae bacterium]
MSDPNTGTGWRQVDLWCEDWRAAEQMALKYLWPLLAEAEDNRSITCWWFIRKGGSWRLRFLPFDGRDETATTFADRMVTALREQGAVRRSAEVVYEPEIHAFGGSDAMGVAHALFHADSRHLLAHLAQRRQDHRRELGLLLGTRLMRAAGQDWYEQGDIWARVAAHRADEHSPKPSPTMVAAVQRLVTATADTDDSPLGSAPAWPAAFEHAGRVLAEENQQGNLTRGLRAVLTHHLLFAFNRLGICAEHQHLLATAASQVVFQQEHACPTGSAGGCARATTVRAVTPDTTTATDTTTSDAETLRMALADYIGGRGTFRTPQVETAFRAVPRHLFLPGVDLTTAYAPTQVVTKRAEDGTTVSSASSPNLVAEMLEALDVAPGHRVLEIGAATGINAALLAELVGPTGTVVTIELDDDLAAGARAGLAAAGYPQVEVICGDGALGHPARAPYDRIIVTAGAWDIVSAWWQQIALGGHLVVPLRLHGSGLTRALALTLHAPGRMISTSAAVCGFVPMRGTTERPERLVPLADDVALHLDAADLPDEAALGQALTYPPHTHWTGVQISDSEPIEHLDLWLATTGSGNFGRLSVGAAARASGLVNPALRWAGATLYDGATLAYLAMRERTDDASELGVIAHGPDSTQLATQVSDLLQRWNQKRPTQPTITAHPIDTPDIPLPSAHHILRPHTRLTITWRARTQRSVNTATTGTTT